MNIKNTNITIITILIILIVTALIMPNFSYALYDSGGGTTDSNADREYIYKSDIQVTRDKKAKININWPEDGIIINANGKKYKVTAKDIKSGKINVTNDSGDEVLNKNMNKTSIEFSKDKIGVGSTVEITYKYSVEMDSYTQAYQYGASTKIPDYAQGEITISFEVEKIKGTEVSINDVKTLNGTPNIENYYETTGLGVHFDGEGESEGKNNQFNKSDQMEMDKHTSANTADEIMNAADDWIKTGEEAVKNGETTSETLYRSMIEQAYNILLAIGFVVIVAVGAILAIQFMLASVEQKAVIKEKLVPYITGCCVVFGAFGIWGTVVRLLGDPSGVSQYENIKNLGTVENADMIKNLGNNIIGIIQIIGSFVAIIILIVLGIKYMTGSVEEKAEYKVTMKNYFIGAILLFGITNFIAIIQTIALGIFK